MQLITLLFCFLMAMTTLMPMANAASASTLARVVKKAVGVTDDVPVKNIDDILEAMGNRQVREAMESVLESDLRRIGKISGDLDPAARIMVITRETPTLTRMLARGGDATALLRQIDNLDDVTKTAALTMVLGGDEIAAVIPDMLTRARFIENGGAPVITAAGVGGKEFVENAMLLDELFKSGRFIQAPGRRAATLADFGNIVLKAPDATLKFFRDHVRPNWKLWAGGTALAIYLTDPEYYQDKAGELTKAGMEHIGRATSTIAAGGTIGFAEGTAAGGKMLVSSLLSLRNPYVFVGAMPILMILFIIWPRGRRICCRMLRKAWYPPFESDKQSTQFEPKIKDISPLAETYTKTGNDDWKDY